MTTFIQISKGHRICAGNCRKPIKKGDNFLLKYHVKFNISFKTLIEYPTVVTKNYCMNCANKLLKTANKELINLQKKLNKIKN